MIGGNTTGRNNDGWVMVLVISQLLLNRMIMARSTEVFGKFCTVLGLYNELLAIMLTWGADHLRARANAESLTETASEFTSISIINLATEPLQPAAVTGMTAGTSQDVSPTNIEQATDTGTIARDTPPSTQVAVTSAFASQAAAASQGGMDIPELSVGTDGILHWQQPALIASQQSEASGAAETSVEMSNAAPVASLPPTLAVESIARVQPSV